MARPAVNLNPDPTLRHRIADATLTVLGPAGRPLADVDVVVAQRRHRFLFGNIGFEFIPLANGEIGTGEKFGGENGTAPAAALADQTEALAELWFDVFNAATLPFYWAGFEPTRGHPDTERLMRTAQWFNDRGVVVKGHPLVWHTLTARWLLELTNEEIERAQRDRIRRDVSDFTGVIDTWDAINEVVIMPVFDKEDNGITRICRANGRIATVRMAFDAAHAANPSATLLLNDFDLSTAYECLIEGVLEAGIRIDVLGLQSHMHQGYWGEEKTLAILDRFSRYGLPIHFTESTLVSGRLMSPEIEDLNDYRVETWPSTPAGEERQADEIVRHYRTLLSHPSVEAVTYWGISDAGAWLGAPAGLVRADGTRKPSYDALRSLVKREWWFPPTTLRTDDAGRIRLSGFLGEYEVSSDSGSARFELAEAGAVACEVGLSVPRA